jgi:aminoglycoside/choline kinase family phosphotransferase
MRDRADARARLLAAAGWGAARAAHLAGDASNRSYQRLTDAAGRRAVLMDAPPDRGEDIRPFVRIARHLAALGLSAPAILAEDATAGFLLLEDLGCALFARAAAADPAAEALLYATATDLLAALHRHPAPADLPEQFTPRAMAESAMLAFEWYVPAVTGARAPAAAEAAFRAEIAALAAAALETPPVLVLADYHAQNLLWLPARTGIARVGLLDFQDAGAGHPAYDLVSLLEDARRDTAPELQAAMTARYLAATGMAEAPFRAAYAAMGAQRNLRILGTFARLPIRDGKPHYADLLPRVWGHLMRDLAHPDLAALARIVRTHIPAPGAAAIAAIKAAS